MVQPPPWPTQKRYVGVPGQVALPVTVMVAPGSWGEDGLAPIPAPVQALRL